MGERGPGTSCAVPERACHPAAVDRTVYRIRDVVEPQFSSPSRSARMLHPPRTAPLSGVSSPGDPYHDSTLRAEGCLHARASPDAHRTSRRGRDACRESGSPTCPRRWKSCRASPRRSAAAFASSSSATTARAWFSAGTRRGTTSSCSPMRSPRGATCSCGGRWSSRTTAGKPPRAARGSGSNAASISARPT